jgi:hypothetical protein
MNTLTSMTSNWGYNTASLARRTRQIIGLSLALGLVASQPALAHGNVSLNIGGMVAPGVYGSIAVGQPYYPPQVVYPQPQVVYQRPQVIYQAPQVVYQQPQVIYQAPMIVNQPAYVVRQPAPIVVGPGYYRHPGRGYGHQYHHHHRHQGGWY